MPSSIERIKANLGIVRDKIAAAAHSAGRSADGITLVGVTKYVDAQTAALLVDAGCTDLGESRPQELWSKAESSSLADKPVRWHLIGHLQRNKVDHTLPLVNLLHSIDSVRLLTAVDQSAAKQSLTVNALLEVNCSGDPEKHGFLPEAMRELVGSLTNYKNVRIQGLMTMAAREGGREVARRNFADLRELRDRLSRSLPVGATLDELSMGMSRDFEQAILEGATIVRVGSALWADL